MQTIKISAAVLASFLVMAAILTWSADHDKKIMEAAAKYEQCVAREYNTSPAAWYAQHGEYPYCNN